MHITSLASLAWKHTQGAIAEEIYLKGGIDATRPIAFYAIVNERCNVRCRYCAYWRLPHYETEMTNEDWQSALLSIRDFVGKFSINFSGGEPFLRRGFIDLLAWCNANGIMAGVTTNGSALTLRNVEKIVAAKPFNINISVDAPSAEIHDYLRGWPGLFDKLSSGIGYLRAERERQGVHFPITIKPTVTSRNFRHLPALVDWAKKVGATSVSMQPMNRWTPETYDELWIEEPDLPELEQVIDQLIAMKRAGAPILTPEQVLSLMPDHFRGNKASPDIMPCRIGLRNYVIKTNGDVESCVHGFPVLGNVKIQSAREIWYNQKARKVRSDTVACDKLCLITCMSQTSLGDRVKMGLQLVKGGSDQPAA